MIQLSDDQRKFIDMPVKYISFLPMFLNRVSLKKVLGAANFWIIFL